MYASYPVKECASSPHSGDDTNTDGSFKCYNGGACLQIELNATTSMQICTCKPGFTGRQCAQRTMPCSPDPCGANGYCNSMSTPQSLDEAASYNGYFCRCKPGFAGVNCQENINECLNATCYNGGSCVDGINSYTCDCKWPYMGRYCQTKMKCTANGAHEEDKICKNNGICVEEGEFGVPRCVCQHGFEGVDCSLNQDRCRTRPCAYGAKCVWLRAENDYKCECKAGRTGKNCQLEDLCSSGEITPCQNNATCINLAQSSSGIQNDVLQYYCQCRPFYTGINCDVKIWRPKTTTLPTTTSTIPTTTSISSTSSTSTEARPVNANQTWVIQLSI